MEIINIDINFKENNLDFLLENMPDQVLFDLKVKLFICEYVNERHADGISKKSSYDKLSEMKFIDNNNNYKTISEGTIKNIYNDANKNSLK